MPRQAQPFQIIQRGKKVGKGVFYVRFRDESGELLSWQVAAGVTSRTAARAWAQKRLKTGVVTTRQTYSFAKYAEHWWIWDRCQYIRGKVARGQQISRRYAQYQRRNLERYILPAFGHRALLKINTGDIEHWLLGLQEKNQLSGLTCNHILATLKVMFSEAFRLGIIPSDPAARVSPLKESTAERVVLTVDEIKTLFDETALLSIWNGDERAYTAAAIAVTCGLRIGEVQALTEGSLSNGYLAVNQAWGRSDGLVEPKYGSRRIVPVPMRVEDHIRHLIDASTNSEPADLIFRGKDRTTPLDHKFFTKRLTMALATVGIDEQERIERGLTFHALRHTAASVMRGKVPDYVVRALTGHKSEKMLDHYGHVTNDALQSVVEVQQKVFG